MKIFFLVVLLFGIKIASPFAVSSRIVSFPNPISENLDDGYILASASINLPDIIISTSFNYKSKWNLYVAGTDLFFTPNIYEKQSSDLLWKLSKEPDSKYRSIKESAEIIMSGFGSQEVELNFKLFLDWQDYPASYSIELEFFLDEQTNDKMIKSKSRQIAR